MRLRRRRNPPCDRCGTPVEVTAAERFATRTGAHFEPAELCAGCLRRGELERQRQRLDREHTPERVREGWLRWLDAAPLELDHPAEPVAGSAASGFFSRRPFVEIVDRDTAAAECARGDRGLGLPPAGHDGVLRGSYDEPPVRFTFWSGSVARLRDGRVVFRWSPGRTATNDH